MKMRKKGCVIAALILGCIIFILAAGTFYYFDVLQLKGIIIVQREIYLKSINAWNNIIRSMGLIRISRT